MRYPALFLLMVCLVQGALAQPPGQNYLVVPHLPSNTDVFNVSIVLENQLAQKRYLGIYPAAADGQTFDPIPLELDPNERRVYNPTFLFKEHPVSFFYVVGHRIGESFNQDTMTGLVVGVALSYANNPENPTFTAAISDPSKHWRVHCGDWEDSFDGLAIVNLDVCASNVFQLNHYDKSGKLLDSQAMGAPRGSFFKEVVNLGAVFEPVAGSYVDIIAPMNMAIIALRGSLDTEGWIVGNMAFPLVDNQKELRVLEENRAKFAGSGIDHYSISIRQTCFCAGNNTREVSLRVMNNWIESFTYTDDQTEVAAEERQIYQTVDQMFDMVETLLNSNLYRVLVEYDPTYGYPISIFTDGQACIADDELTITMSEFLPLR